MFLFHLVRELDHSGLALPQCSLQIVFQFAKQRPSKLLHAILLQNGELFSIFHFLIHVHKSFLMTSFSIPQLCSKLELLMSRLFAVLTSAVWLHILSTKLSRQILSDILRLRLLRVELESRLINDGASFLFKNCSCTAFHFHNLLSRFLLRS